jgi:hypothetical protein
MGGSSWGTGRMVDRLKRVATEAAHELGVVSDSSMRTDLTRWSVDELREAKAASARGDTVELRRIVRAVEERLARGEATPQPLLKWCLPRVTRETLEFVAETREKGGTVIGDGAGSLVGLAFDPRPPSAAEVPVAPVVNASVAPAPSSVSAGEPEVGAPAPVESTSPLGPATQAEPRGRPSPLTWYSQRSRPPESIMGRLF